MAAKSVSEPKPGVYVFDFGQNLAGVERVRLQGPEGTNVKLRFAEILNDDGTLYTDNLRTAKVTDHFILDGTARKNSRPISPSMASATRRLPACHPRPPKTP